MEETYGHSDIANDQSLQIITPETQMTIRNNCSTKDSSGTQTDRYENEARRILYQDLCLSPSFCDDEEVTSKDLWLR